jgi:methionyl-tRNA synthetase
VLGVAGRARRALYRGEQCEKCGGEGEDARLELEVEVVAAQLACVNG